MPPQLYEAFSEVSVQAKILFFKPLSHFFFSSHSRLHHTHVELKLPISESNPK